MSSGPQADVTRRPMTAAVRQDGAPAGLEDYRRAGGYEGLHRALHEMTPARITQVVQDSGLRGRGGAGFSAGRKWSYVPADSPLEKYVVCNIDEMEPGSFKDRFLIERNPHLLIEGVAIAAAAIGAATAYLFFRGEYQRPAAVMRAALDEARAAGLIGERVMGTGFSLDVHIHLSGGRYLCGEASALLNALEGRRAVPRFRPPHMASAGLWSHPTIVNNVETLCCVPSIVRDGAEHWKSLGATEEGGTKIYTVAGRVQRPGAWELPVGTPMREIIEQHAGGLLHGLLVKAVVPGGASSSLVPERDMDVAMDFASMERIGSRLGTGTMVVVDDHLCIVALLLNMERFFAQESCGWCTPCWAGLPWVVSLLEALEAGTAEAGDLARLDHLTWLLGGDHPFCDHAPGAMQPLASALRLFRDDFEAHVSEGCRWRR